MTNTELFCKLQDSVEACSAMLKIRDMKRRDNTAEMLKGLRIATAAAQELDNRAAGNSPKELAP